MAILTVIPLPAADQPGLSDGMHLPTLRTAYHSHKLPVYKIRFKYSLNDGVLQLQLPGTIPQSFPVDTDGSALFSLANLFKIAFSKL